MVFLRRERLDRSGDRERRVGLRRIRESDLRWTVLPSDFMFRIDQSASNNVIIRNCEQEGCAFLSVTGNSDVATIALQSNSINPAATGALPSIVIEGYNRVVGVGNEIAGGIALNSLGAKYIGLMDRFGPTPLNAPASSQVPGSVLVNIETMHANATDVVSGDVIYGAPAGQMTLQPGSNHPELTGIAGDVCTRAGGRCLTWAARTSVTGGYLYQPTIDNGHQYYSQGGTTGLTEPAWPTSHGGTVTDGSVIWTEAGQSGVFEGFGPLDHYKHSSGPTSGYHRQGAIVWNSAPRPDGYVGWVCTATGNPGTWLGFGRIMP
jgi:hypothetical protein